MGTREHYGFGDLTLGSSQTAALIKSDTGVSALAVTGTRTVVDGAKAHGGKAITVVSSGAYAIFRLAVPGAAGQTRLASSFYFYPEQAADQNFVEVRTAAEGRVCALGIAANGKLRALDGTTIGESAATVALNSLSRCEWLVDAAAGTTQARLFAGDSLTAYASLTVTGHTFTNGTVGLMNFGSANNIASTTTFSDIQLENDRAAEIGIWAPRLPTPVLTLVQHTNPSAPGMSDGKERVSWPAVAGAVRYSAARAAGYSPAQEDFVEVASNVTSPYEFTGQPEGAWSYAVRAEPS